MRALLLFAAAVGAADPFADGPHGVKRIPINKDGDEFWNYAVHAPDAAGSFPLILFITGGGGASPAGSSYNALWGHVVSHGVIVVELSKGAKLKPNFPGAGAKMNTALDYFKANLTGILASNGIEATPDFTKIAYSGQSAGNHVFCEALKQQCGDVKAAVMINPVDGADPFGIEKMYCIPRDDGAKTEFSIPAVHIEAGWEHVPDGFGVACAPAAISNDHYYNAWTGPIWKVNATDYGHGDCGGDGAGNSTGLGCPSGHAALPPYRKTISGLITAFFGLVFGGDASQQQVLEDVSALPVRATGKHNYNGRTSFAGGCTHI